LFLLAQVKTARGLPGDPDYRFGLGGAAPPGPVYEPPEAGVSVVAKIAVQGDGKIVATFWKSLV
jgi:hypothetical protein